MRQTIRPYIDYEDDESVLPLMGARELKRVSRGADWNYHHRRKKRGGGIGHRGLKRDGTRGKDTT